jgi:hypothetical protein
LTAFEIRSNEVYKSGGAVSAYGAPAAMSAGTHITPAGRGQYEPSVRLGAFVQPERAARLL